MDETSCKGCEWKIKQLKIKMAKRKIDIYICTECNKKAHNEIGKRDMIVLWHFSGDIIYVIRFITNICLCVSLLYTCMHLYPFVCKYVYLVHPEIGEILHCSILSHNHNNANK